MQEIELTIKVVKQILTEDILFQQALKSAFKLDSKEKTPEDEKKELAKLQPVVATLSGSILRHYLLLDTIVKKGIPQDVEISLEDRILIYIVLVNFYFVKKLDVDEVFSYYSKKKLFLDLKDITSKYSSIYDLLNILIPAKDSNEYYAARFNTPSWLIAMWFKHFGRTTTFKILRENVKSRVDTVRINTLNSSFDKLEMNSPGLFEKTSYENLLLYKGKLRLRRTNAFRNDEVFIEERAVKSIVNSILKGRSHREIFIYSEDDDSLPLDMILTLKREVGIYLGVDNKERRPSLARFIRKSGQRNVSYFEAKTDSLEAYVTSKPSLVVVEPNSSHFDKIRTYPDYLIHFKREQLDSYIANQKKVLEDLSAYVDEGGTLVYLVDTLNRKETSSIIISFLLEHEEFTLVDEKQYFPFDRDGGAFYFAMLRRKDENEK